MNGMDYSSLCSQGGGVRDFNIATILQPHGGFWGVSAQCLRSWGMRDNFVLNKRVVICRILEIIIFIFLMPKSLQFCLKICQNNNIKIGKLKLILIFSSFLVLPFKKRAKQIKILHTHISCRIIKDDF